MNATPPKISILTLIDPRQEFYERMKKFSGADLMAVNKAMHGMVVAELKKRKAEIVSEQLVDSKEKVRSGVEAMAENGAEALLLHVPGWTFPILGALAAQNAKMRGIPTMVYGSAGLSGPTAVKGAIDEIGVWNRAVYGQPVDPAVFDEIAGFAAAAACVNRLRGATFGMFGGRAMGITTGIVDSAQWQKLFGVDIEHVDQIEIVRAAEKAPADQIEKHFQWLRKNVKSIDEDGDSCTIEKIRKQVASYLAVKGLVEKHRFDFVGMKCQPELSDYYVNQCLAVAFLNDPYDADGSKATVPCSCEVDANSALTMQILKLLSGGNRIVKFPELYEIRLSVWAPESKRYTSKFYFLEHLGEVGNALRAGPHSPGCEYASADLSFAGCGFTVEYACSDDGGLACRTTPRSVAEPFTLILVEVLRPWQLDGEVELDDDNAILIAGNEGGLFRIFARQEFHSVHHRGATVTRGIYSSENELVESLKTKGNLNGLAGKGRIAAVGFLARMPLKVLACQATKSADAPEELEEDADRLTLVVDEKIDSAARNYREKTHEIRGGPFEGCARAVSSVMNWCAVWDQLHDRPYTPISRAWIDEYMVRIGFDRAARGPLIGLWDNLFNALLHSLDSRELAEANVRAVLDDSALIDGEYPPNYIVSTFRSGDRSQPPIGALVVWKLFRKFENLDFMKWAYPRLKKWHQWWKEKRDGNRDGLLEWGSNRRVKEQSNDAGTLFAAACESGMDNSPLYDGAAFDPAIGTMNLSDVGLNAFHAANAFYLSKIAGTLGYTADVETFQKEYESSVLRINDELWNSDRKAYLDRYWDGNFSARLAPTMFYPLMASIPSSERAAELVENHFWNEDEFRGEFMLTSISRDDPAFNDQLYWRGRVWPSMNYLVYLGLKAYRMDQAARELAVKSVRLFMNEWQTHGHAHENYNAVTGTGDDVPIAARPFSQGSDRFYSWAALLALIGVEELIDVEMDRGIRFGSRELESRCEASGILLRGSVYRVETCRDGTSCFRDGKQIFSSVPGTTVRCYEREDSTISFDASGSGLTRFSICEFAPGAAVSLIVRDNVVETLRADSRGAAGFSIDVSSDYTKVELAKREQ